VLPRRPAWSLLLWTGSILATLVLAWFSGFLYWHFRITRSFSEIRDEAANLIANERGFKSRLAPAGSRALPYFIGEFRDAVARNDRDTAVVLYWEFEETAAAAENVTFQGGDRRVGADTPMDATRDFPYMANLWWQLKRPEYPPGWMWWSGRRRGP